MAIKAATTYILPLAVLLCCCGQMPEELNGSPSATAGVQYPYAGSLHRQFIKDAPLITMSLFTMHEGVLVSAQSTLNLSCNNVFGTASAGDWTQSNISATSTVSLIAGKTCTITLVSYNDGTNTYSAVGAALVIPISSSGVVTSVSPLKYTSGGGSPVFQWFSAVQGGSAYSVIISYTAETLTNTNISAPTNLSSQTVSLSVASITAPVVASLGLNTIAGTNGAQASYTLTASVSGSSNCKLIDNSSATYTPTSWSSVNNAYAASSTTCPTFVDGQAGFTIGNWTSYWVTGNKTLIMWANTVNGQNAYTVANIGP